MLVLKGLQQQQQTAARLWKYSRTQGEKICGGKSLKGQSFSTIQQIKHKYKLIINYKTTKKCAF